MPPGNVDPFNAGGRVRHGFARPPRRLVPGALRASSTLDLGDRERLDSREAPALGSVS